MIRQLYTTRQLAALMQVSEGLIKSLRSSGEGPDYVLIKTRVRYPRQNIEKWLGIDLSEEGYIDGGKGRRSRSELENPSTANGKASRKSNKPRKVHASKNKVVDEPDKALGDATAGCT